MITKTKQPKIRINLYIPRQMEADLRALSNQTGAPVAELVRRAVAAYLAANVEVSSGVTNADKSA